MTTDTHIDIDIDHHVRLIASNYVVNSGIPVKLILCFDKNGMPMSFEGRETECITSVYSGMGHWPIGIPFTHDDKPVLGELENAEYYILSNIDAAFLVTFSGHGYAVIKLYTDRYSKNTYVSLKMLSPGLYYCEPKQHMAAIPQQLASIYFPHKVLTLQYTRNKACFVSMRMSNPGSVAQQCIEQSSTLRSLLYGGVNSVDFLPLCHVEESNEVCKGLSAQTAEQMRDIWLLFMVQFSTWLYIVLLESDENQKITLEFVTMTGHRVLDEIDVQSFTGDREFRDVFGHDLTSRQEVIQKATSFKNERVDSYMRALTERLLVVFFFKLRARTGVLFEYDIYMAWNKMYEKA